MKNFKKKKWKEIGPRTFDPKAFSPGVYHPRARSPGGHLALRHRTDFAPQVSNLWGPAPLPPLITLMATINELAYQKCIISVEEQPHKV